MHFAVVKLHLIPRNIKIMELSSSTGGNEGFRLDFELLNQYLPGLENFAIDEEIADSYVRYRAVHAEASLPVWIHHFREVEDSIIEGLPETFAKLGQLQEPRFLRPLGQVKIEGGLLLVTDAAIDGRRLDTLLHEVDPAEARNWAGELSGALGTLHEAGLVHGRLCPQAIYMTPSGVKILGAGFADLWLPVWESMDQDDQLPPRLFTSLEVRLDGIANGCPQSDVFSLGTILYRGYTGAFPGEFCPLPSDKAEVPRSVDTTVMVSMHPESASRQQTMDEFMDEFTGVRVRETGKWEPRALADNLSGTPGKKHRFDGAATWINSFHWWALAIVVLGVLAWKGIEMVRKKENVEPEVAERPIEKPEPETSAEAEEVAEAPVSKLEQLLRYADLAAAQENWFLEYEALQQALQIAPENSIVIARLDANPWQVREDVQSAITLLKLSNPRQTEWRILADFEQGGCRLDLSGNQHLQNISGLVGLRLLSVDLSGTNVVDLSPLVESPPRELRVKRLPIGEHIAGFDPERTTITAKDLPYPSPGKLWESPTGLRFAPILDGSVLLATTEVTHRLFEKFATEDEGSGSPAGMQNLREGKWVDLGNNWRRPGFETHPEFPVIGVTLEEAERFCDWLTQRDRNTGKISRDEFYRLPTDYEWGVAAGFEEHPLLDAAGRSRSATRMARRDDLRIAEGFEPAEKLSARRQEVSLSQVGKRIPTGAFHDLAGNVREWVTDRRNDETPVARGGAEGRIRVQKDLRREDIGFRVVLDLGRAELPELDELVESKAWQRAREVALVDAFDPRNRHAREAGLSFLQMREKVAVTDRRMPPDPAFTDEFGGYRYQLVRLPMDWEEARKFARDAGGRLVCADDLRRLQWLTRISGEEPVSMWLGARCDDRGWRWEDDSTPQNVELPDSKSSDDRLLLTTDRSLEAADLGERYPFVIEWQVPQDSSQLAHRAGEE